MLLLLFQAGDHLYAIDTAHITEVIPIVALRKIHSVPDHVAGVFNYRGSILPMIDLCHLIQGTACRSRFSTRIIIVNYDDEIGTHQLGLMAERVTETLNRPDLTSTPTDLANASFLGNLFMDEKGMIQQIHWQQLIANIQPVLLEKTLQPNGASSS